jgi:hypothetical protein
VNATSSAVSQVVQARTDVVIGGGGSKALGLGFSSRIDTATMSSPRAMGGTELRIGALVGAASCWPSSQVMPPCLSRF